MTILHNLMSSLTMPVLGLPRTTKRLTVLFVDIFLCITSVYISFYLRIGSWLPLLGEIWNLPLVMSGVSVVIAIPIFIVSGLYREIFRFSGWMALISLLRAIAIYSLFSILIFTVYGLVGIPRTIGLLQPIILSLLIAASRGVASYWLGNAYRRQLRLVNLPRALIYGAGEAGRQLAGAMSHSYAMQVVGFLDDDNNKIGQILVGHRIYNAKKLVNLVKDLKIDIILLAIPTASRYRRNEIINLVRDAKVLIQTLPSLSDLVNGMVTTADLKSLDIDDLLSRNPVKPDEILISKYSNQKIVLITGAGGSIGSELCRQILDQHPKQLVLVEQNEYALYLIQLELTHRLEKNGFFGIKIISLLADVTNKAKIYDIVECHKPDIIYHAAAYKHVHLVELNAIAGAYNNIFGTLAVSEVAIDLDVKKFILISTDKAVRPTNVMGATKRVAEMILQVLSNRNSGTTFSMVRFGNVLNSSGSVVPMFQRQIKNGGPLTVTDFRATRFFMTIPEAAQLVIQAAAMATGGDVFLLDMGVPVKIIDLARRMIELSGFQVKDLENPNGDIEIEEVGLKGGEKLFEELLISGAPQKTSHPRIFKSIEDCLKASIFWEKIDQLEVAIKKNDSKLLKHILQEMVPGYSVDSVNLSGID